MRETARRFNILILVLTLLFAPVTSTWAQSSSPIDDATAVQTASGIARPGLPKTTTSKQVPRTKPCNRKRRALVGAAVGAVIGMVAVKKAAEANDGTIGGKVTLQAGGYGAALGMVVGLATCR